uniref:Transposase n=1 Tax=Steinernema glaseri TaxID=37863 RepID=A0A1I7Z9E5_9BILA
MTGMAMCRGGRVECRDGTQRVTENIITKGFATDEMLAREARQNPAEQRFLGDSANQRPEPSTRPNIMSTSLHDKTEPLERSVQHSA